MRELELTIQPASTARKETATAWFVSGESPAAWVTAVITANSSTHGVKLRPVGPPGGTAVGVVISGIDTPPQPDWIPYVETGNGILIPRASRFHPHVAAAELTRLAASDAIAEYVWHPAFGLTAYEPSQILTIADLLTIPAAGTADWDRAQPGVAVCQRLISVWPDETLTPERVIEAGRDDIGSDAADISTAPRSSDESSPISDIFAGTMRPLAHMARWLAKLVPATASAPTWVNAVSDWASGILQNAGISQSKRLNELRRLMSMLDDNPDQGLKYAIPFGGDASRGVAPGSNELTGHGVEFGSGHGGGAADYWDMPYEMQIALTQRYRELALREVSLGRYRRAAYIYATLLGDNASAAHTLADGGYYREAAQLYRDKLNDKRRAAECLLKGGLWPDAVEIYTELADWPAVAGVYEKLEDHKGARQAWLAASAAYVSAGNFLQAANVQEEHLDDAVAAEELLVRGWETSSADTDCLSELFELFERTNNQNKSRQWVSNLGADQRLPVRQQREVAGLFANLSQRYPDADLRADAFRHSREIVARRIPHTTDADRRQFLSILEKLIPADRLLGRDCRRYAQQQKSSVKPATTGGLQQVDQFRLRSDVEWDTAACSGKSVFVAGFSGDSLVAATWTQERQPAVNYHTFHFARERRNRILLAPSSEQSGRVLLHVCQATDTEVLEMNLHQGASRIRPLPFFDRTIVAAGTGRDGKICTLNAGHAGIELRGYLERGAPVSRWVLPLEVTSMEPDAFVKPFGGAIVVCVIENTIAVVRPKPGVDAAVTPEDRAAPVDIEHFRLVGQACGMSAVDNSDMPRVAITTQEGGIVHWVCSGREEPFGADLHDPVCNFMINEDLVVASANGELEVYRTRSNTLALSTRYQGQEGLAIAVLPGVHVSHDDHNEFIVVRANGDVDTWNYRA